MAAKRLHPKAIFFDHCVQVSISCVDDPDVHHLPPAAARSIEFLSWIARRIFACPNCLRSPISSKEYPASVCLGQLPVARTGGAREGAFLIAE